MIPATPFAPQHWEGIKLAAFDVDGTLYDQAPLRWRMARDMALHALRSGSAVVPTVVGHYRRLREEMGDNEIENFEVVLVDETARRSRRSRQEVEKIVDEWINLRPLKYLANCRYDGVAELFAGLKRHGKIVGVISDYPALGKLAAMALAADHIVSANDKNVGILKPHPKGLMELMARTDADASSTVLVGDRTERDGIAARRAGVRSLIRTSRPRPEFQTFRNYRDPIFAPMLGRG